MKTRVLIIGGGVTGAGLARDLSLRGVSCILVEKKDINAGASGGNHGLLHSGARYISSDPAAALECREESLLLKKNAAHCIEETGGLFVAVEGDDESYIGDFPNLCAKSKIPTEALDIEEALELEPNLSPNTIAAYRVEDATVDPFKLSLDNISQARKLGAVIKRHTRVVSFKMSRGKIQMVRLVNDLTREDVRVEPEIIVNASGAWAGEIAALAGIKMNIIHSKGSLLATHERHAQRVINRLRKATDGDILVPNGTVSILGTTSVRAKNPDYIFPEIDEVDYIIKEGADMMPILGETRYIRAYCGVRPLVGGNGDGDDRSVSRGFYLTDHEGAGPDNFITITGGKLTTYRLMAEKTADLVCKKLGVNSECKTKTEPLPSSEEAKWTEPGLAPSVWIKKNDPDDLILCECEMVSQSTVESIASSIREQNGPPTLKSIGLRSRIGKGPCQGSFCSQRVASHLYDIGHLTGNQGPDNLRDFLCARWRGLRPLLWETPLVQSELQEAMHCGFFCLDSGSPWDLEEK